MFYVVIGLILYLGIGFGIWLLTIDGRGNGAPLWTIPAWLPILILSFLEEFK